jgi:hypothetical protein
LKSEKFKGFSEAVPDTEGPLLEYAKVTNQGYFEWATA